MLDNDIQHRIDQIAFRLAFRQQYAAFQIQVAVCSQIILEHLIFAVGSIELPQQFQLIISFKAPGAASTRIIP